MNRSIFSITLLAMALMLTVGSSFAADPLAVAPDMYKLKFENERVRVMEVTFQPGQSIPEHSHPDHFVYVVEGGKLKITKTNNGMAEVTLNAGDILWINAETHNATNTGSSTVRLLVTEFKPSK